MRKLIDNLVSHRNKVYDSLNHNYQMVLQNSNICNKYAGLVVIDEIVERIRETMKVNRVNDSEENTNMSIMRT